MRKRKRKIYAPTYFKVGNEVVANATGTKSYYRVQLRKVRENGKAVLRAQWWRIDDFDIRGADALDAAFNLKVE